MIAAVSSAETARPSSPITLIFSGEVSICTSWPGRSATDGVYGRRGLLASRERRRVVFFSCSVSPSSCIRV
ncbi:hypothetical protein SALBM311S_11345 [Streptomyces alboniger]